MKKIMFNDRYGLTEAVLSGRKTQTRRIVPKRIFQSEHDIDDDARKIWIEDMYGDWHDVRKSKYCFKVGEVVAIAQSYKDCTEECIKTTGLEVTTKPHLAKEPGYKNKMFVRADIMPHRIRITNVRMERLQDISDEDCFREGIRDYSTPNEKRFGFSDFKREDIFCSRTPRGAYAVLIDHISGNGTWLSNPYVFVYDFELVK
jgi:hypothetical protein